MNLRERIARALESFCIDDGTTTQFDAAVDAVLAALPEAVSTPVAWVVAIEEKGAMRVYGPQYRTLKSAEQDAALPMARGQKAEVWECHQVMQTSSGDQSGSFHLEQ